MNTINTNETMETTREVLDRLGIAFSDDDSTNRVQQHVSVHKYLIDTEQNTDHPWEEAVTSWQTRVLSPLKSALEQEDIKRAFPGRTVGDLYLEVSDHWYYLKERRADVGPEEAADSFALRYGKALTRFFSSIPVRAAARALSRGVARSEAITQNMDRAKTQYDTNLNNYASRMFV